MSRTSMLGSTTWCPPASRVQPRGEQLHGFQEVKQGPEAQPSRTSVRKFHETWRSTHARRCLRRHIRCQRFAASKLPTASTRRHPHYDLEVFSMVSSMELSCRRVMAGHMSRVKNAQADDGVACEYYSALNETCHMEVPTAYIDVSGKSLARPLPLLQPMKAKSKTVLKTPAATDATARRTTSKDV